LEGEPDGERQRGPHERQQQKSGLGRAAPQVTRREPTDQ
jgi:hypothetical protein